MDTEDSVGNYYVPQKLHDDTTAHQNKNISCPHHWDTTEEESMPETRHGNFISFEGRGDVLSLLNSDLGQAAKSVNGKDPIFLYNPNEPTISSKDAIREGLPLMKEVQPPQPLSSQPNGKKRVRSNSDISNQTSCTKVYAILDNRKFLVVMGVIFAVISIFICNATYVYIFTGTVNASLGEIQEHVGKEVTRINAHVRSLKLHTPTHKEGDNKTDETEAPGRTYLEVNSYTEYQQKAYQHRNRYPIELVIHLREIADWPTNVPMFQAEGIHKLTLNGTFNINVLFNILSQTISIETLHIINSDGICSDSNRKQMLVTNNEQFQFLLQNISESTFEGFDSCGHVYTILQRSLRMRALHKLAFERSLIDNNNVKSLRHLLETNKHSLQSIHFIDTKWEANMFGGGGDDLSPMHQVDDVHIDFGSSNIALPVQDITKRFAALFPNLLTFTSLNGYISEEQLSEILRCKNLFNITVGLLVTKDVRVNIMQVLKDAPASLLYVYIRLRFTELGTGEECQIDGLAEAREKYNIEWGANCIMMN